MDKNTNALGVELSSPVVHDWIATLKPADVLQVYSGKPGCMCGCNGKYSVNPAHKAEADEGRGYDTDVGAGMRMVNKVLRILQADPRARVLDGHILYLADTRSAPVERAYVVYLCKSKAI